MSVSLLAANREWAQVPDSYASLVEQLLRAPGVDPYLPVWGTGEWDWQGFIGLADQAVHPLILADEPLMEEPVLDVILVRELLSGAENRHDGRLVVVLHGRDERAAGCLGRGEALLARLLRETRGRRAHGQECCGRGGGRCERATASRVVVASHYR